MLSYRLHKSFNAFAAFAILFSLYAISATAALAQQRDIAYFIDRIQALKAADAKPDKIIACCDAGLKRDPNNSYLLVHRGAAYRKTGETDKALADFNRAESVDPKNGDLYKERAFLFQKQGNSEAALKEYGKAIKFKPTTRVYKMRGNLLEQNKQFEKALADYDSAYALCMSASSPEDKDGVSEVLMYRGRLNFRLNRLDAALADCNKALKIHPHSRKVLETRAEIYEAKKQWQKALADYDGYIATNPLNLRGHLAKVRIYELQGNLKSALAELNKCININPGQAYLFYKRSSVYQKLKQDALALADKKAAERLESELTGTQ